MEKDIELILTSNFRLFLSFPRDVKMEVEEMKSVDWN